MPEPTGALPLLAALGVEPKRRDDLVQRVAEAALSMRRHPHERDDIYCLNLAGWIGERAPALLAHIAALEAELRDLVATSQHTRTTVDGTDSGTCARCGVTLRVIDG